MLAQAHILLKMIPGNAALVDSNCVNYVINKIKKKSVIYVFDFAAIIWASCRNW